MAHNSNKKTVCVVSPDLMGPVRNGGIGTHCYWLLRELSTNANLDVSFLYTGDYESGSLSQFREQYAQIGVKYYDLQEIRAFAKTELVARTHPQLHSEWFIERSMLVLAHLQQFHYDFIHFQDWQGNGFKAVQAKKTGLCLQSSFLTVTLHSPSEWVRSGMREWSDTPVSTALLDYCERYVAENVDLVISPAKHMLSWLNKKGWRLSEQQAIIPCCFDTQISNYPQVVDLSHLVFFGRLETCKGLELFCESLLELLSSESQHGLKKVSFLGKKGRTSRSLWGDEYVNSMCGKLQQLGLEINLQTTLTSKEALNYLVESGGIAVIPSLLDNVPFTVVECIEHRIPLLASRVGGIPELISSEALFDPNRKSLIQAIVNRESRIQGGSSIYSALSARKAWQELHSKVLDKRVVDRDLPKVAVCIPYFNYGRYLPQLLKSLENSSYLDFEVIVVDDGSTDEQSRTAFDQLKYEYAERNWQFIRRENAGIGATRNFAATQTSAELLVFMDSDNVACPEMLKTLVLGLIFSGADCLTCHFKAFLGDDMPDAYTPIEYGVLPYGACVEVGILANIFGDANFCIRRTVFEQLQGFDADRSCSFEDWEFLARLVLSGYHLEVIPQNLFWYRHLEGGFSRSTNQYLNNQRIVELYSRMPPSNLSRIFSNLLYPLFNQVQKYAEHSAQISQILSGSQQENQALVTCLRGYDRFGYRIAQKILVWLDTHEALKVFLQKLVHRSPKSAF